MGVLAWLVGGLAGLLLVGLAFAWAVRANDRQVMALIRRGREADAAEAGATQLPSTVAERQAKRRAEQQTEQQGRTYRVDGGLPVVELPASEPETGGPLVRTIRRPKREPTIESDVVVPLAQALVGALIAGLLVLAVWWAAGWRSGLQWALVAVLAVLGVAWLNRLGFVSALLWEIEELTGLELTGDDRRGRPSTHLGNVNPDDAASRGRQLRQVTEAADELERLGRFVREICTLRATSERALGIQPGTRKREDFVAFRDRLMRLGLAYWKDPDNPNAGWSLVTWDAERIMAVVAAHVVVVGEVGA